MSELVDIIRRILHLERRVNRLESLETPTIGGGGGVPGAPNDAQYVTLALDAGLTNERVLTEGADIDLVDTGANGTITVGRGGDTILLFDSGGNPVAEYAATSAGLVAAVAAATSGDIIRLYACNIALAQAITLAAGVSLCGTGWNSKITAAGFNGTAITLSADSRCENLELDFTSNGATAIGVDASALRATVHLCHVTAHGGAATNIAVQLGVAGDGPATLSVHGSSNHITHVTPEYWSDDVHDNGTWTGAGFRLQSAGAFANGYIRVTVHFDSGSLPALMPIKIMSSNDSGSSGVAPNVLPTLSANTSGYNAGYNAGDTLVMDGDGGTAWTNDGYFCITTGWTPAGWSFGIHITLIEWVDIGGAHTLWTQAIHDQHDLPIALRCKFEATGAGADAMYVAAQMEARAAYNLLDGATNDAHADGTLWTQANEHTNGLTSGTLVEAWGDRSAWDVTNYAARHASDINAGVYLRHLAAPSAAGNVMRDTGAAWASVAAASYIPFAPTARGDMIVADAVPTWARLALTVPGAGICNYLGVNNGEVTPTWKSASSNPGAAAAILATDSGGHLTLTRLFLALGSDTCIMFYSTTLGAVSAAEVTWNGPATTLAVTSATAKLLVKNDLAAGIGLDPNAKTGGFNLYLSPSNLSANRRVTFPDADGTAALLEVANVFTAAQTDSLSDANYSSVVTPLTIRHNGTVPASVLAGFGAGINFVLDSNATANRTAGSLSASWVNSTDATRRSEARLAVAFAANAEDVLIIQASSAAWVAPNALGDGAIMLMTKRGLAAQTASGETSTLVGGYSNTASAVNTTVVGGYLSTASGQACTIVGSASSTASGVNGVATVVGGSSNTASAYCATVVGGTGNTASGMYSLVAGYQSVASGTASTAFGVTATASHTYAVSISCDLAAFNSVANYTFNVAASGGTYFVVKNATTNAVDVGFTYRHNSTGTAANGFGYGVKFQLDSSTTANQDAAQIAAVWVNATHGSRTAKLQLSAYDTAVRLGLEVEATGSAANVNMIGSTYFYAPVNIVMLDDAVVGLDDDVVFTT